MPARSSSARGKGIETHSTGDVEAWGGIVSAHLSDWAEALDTTPEAVLNGVKTAGIDLMVDTATAKGQSRSDTDRATDPSLRCIAMSTDDAERLSEAIN